MGGGVVKLLNKHYTGIGSRRTPAHILQDMTKLGSYFSEQNWVLRSGGADGADRAFEQGVRLGKSAEIYTPWEGFAKYSDHIIIGSKLSTYNQAEDIAKDIHPAWDKCSRGAKALHTRNIFQVLGSDLNTPSKFVIFWAEETHNGNVKGGTRTAVELARQYDIPCINMYKDNWRDIMRDIWKEVR